MEAVKEAPALKLWEIGDKYAEVLDKLEANGGELTPELEAALDAIEDDFDEKVRRVAAMIRNDEALAEAWKKEGALHTKRGTAKANGAKGLRSYLAREMKRVEVTKVEGGARLGASEKVLLDIDPAKLPPKYRERHWKALTSSIKGALKAGEEIPGARLETTNHVTLI